MKIEEFLSRMTPELHQALRQSLELGKWPDGQRLTAEQRNVTLRALMIYEHQHIAESERIGYMPQQCKGKSAQNDDDTVESIIRFSE